MTLLEQIAELQRKIAILSHGGELLWYDYRKLADLQRQRAEAAEAELARLREAAATTTAYPFDALQPAPPHPEHR